MKRTSQMKRTRFFFAVTIFAGSLLLRTSICRPSKIGRDAFDGGAGETSHNQGFRFQGFVTTNNFSSLLWACFGINRADGKRTAPSANDKRATDVYVLLKQGAYVYDAKANKLNLVLAEDVRKLGYSPGFRDEPPVTLIFVADLSKDGRWERRVKKNMAQYQRRLHLAKRFISSAPRKGW